MDAKLQAQLDAQIQKKRVSQVVEHSEAPSFTPDIFEYDERETSLAEINFRDMSARVVESSDAPKITRKVLETLGKPIKTVEIFFENLFWQVAVRDGIPLELEIKQLKMLLEYADREGNPAAMEERNLEISRMLLSGMMADPQFSYKGEGEGAPIEARSPVMIASLSEAFSVVNTPQEDAIFQVTVRRGLPEDRFHIFRDLDWYTVGGKQKKYTDMSEEELSAEMARNTARRQVLVPAMLVDPKLTWTQVADDADAEVIEPPEDAEAPFPVELLSERFMQTLNMAHRIVTTPEAALRSLQHHFRSLTDTERAKVAGEPVGDDGG